MMSAPKQRQDLPELGAADAIRETYITRRISNLVDEETGRAWDRPARGYGGGGGVSVPPARVWLNFSEESESVEDVGRRRGRRWIAAGIVVLLVVALSVGLAARTGGGVEEPSVASTAPEASAGSDAALADVSTDTTEVVKAKAEAPQDGAGASASAAVSARRSKVPNLFDDVALSGGSADDVEDGPSDSPSIRPEPQRDVHDADSVASVGPSAAVGGATSSSPPTATGSPSVEPSPPSREPSSAPTRRPAPARPDLSGWTPFRWDNAREAGKTTPRPPESP